MLRLDPVIGSFSVPERPAAMFDELRGAVGRNELDLVFQPKVNLQTYGYAGAEVLVRWQSRLVGRVPPSVFIPIAEEFGLIGSIGAWVITQTAARYVSLPSCITKKTLAINVSGAQIQDARFVPWLCSVMDAAGIPGASVEIELTETALLGDLKLAAGRLGTLRDRGITITLDDFGTGYSALSHLRMIPVDTVKIAPDFVADIPRNPASGKLVGAVVALAKALDLKVVAEGIETAEQAKLLSDLGCDMGQGYFFARPMNLDALASWVSNAEATQSVA